MAERREAAGGALEERAYRYGADDQLREVRQTDARGGGRVTRFGYDALGRRVWKATARLTGAVLLAAGAVVGTPAEASAAAPEPPAEGWARTTFVWAGDVLLAESERPAEDALATVYAYEPGGFRPLPDSCSRRVSRTARARLNA